MPGLNATTATDTDSLSHTTHAKKVNVRVTCPGCGGSGKVHTGLV